MIGLVPLATGMGVDFSHFKFVTRSETTMMWAPMAWAIFWGLLFNTILVLIVTPTLYHAWESMNEKRRAKKEARKAKQAGLSLVTK
jgi:multidrug efflux pump subunit AcrB